MTEEEKPGIINPYLNAEICLCGRYRLVDFLFKAFPDTGLFHHIPELWKLFHNQKEIERIAKELFQIDIEYKTKVSPADIIYSEAIKDREKAEKALIKELREQNKE